MELRLPAAQNLQSVQRCTLDMKRGNLKYTLVLKEVFYYQLSLKPNVPSQLFVMGNESRTATIPLVAQNGRLFIEWNQESMSILDSVTNQSK